MSTGQIGQKKLVSKCRAAVYNRLQTGTNKESRESCMVGAFISAFIPESRHLNTSMHSIKHCRVQIEYQPDRTGKFQKCCAEIMLGEGQFIQRRVTQALSTSSVVRTNTLHTFKYVVYPRSN